MDLKPHSVTKKAPAWLRGWGTLAGPGFPKDVRSKEKDRGKSHSNHQRLPLQQHWGSAYYLTTVSPAAALP